MVGSSCLYPPQTPSSSLTLYFWVHFEFGPTEFFVLAGFVSFDHLPMHLKVEKKSFRSYREGRVASYGWSLLLAELPFALTYFDIAERLLFSLREEYDYLVYFLLLNWWLGNASLGCFLLLDVGM